MNSPIDQEVGATIEEWRDLPAIGPYRVSNLGRVFSLVKNRLLTGTPIKGYINVRIGVGRKLHPIHRLVCIAFHGTAANEMMAGHLDGNPQNNRADNLAWITRAENTRHSIKHGTFASMPPVARGEAHPRAKLTAAQVAEIRASNLTRKQAAAQFGISPRTVAGIRCGKGWRI